MGLFLRRVNGYVIKPGVNLTLADLSGANLTGANLRGADLTGVDLTRANLVGANLSGVDLSRLFLFNTTMPDGRIALDLGTRRDFRW